MSDKSTGTYGAVVPGGVKLPGMKCTAVAVKDLFIMRNDGCGHGEFAEVKDVSRQPDGGFLFAAKRTKDGLWVAAQIIPHPGCKDELKRGSPRRQILGLKMAGNQPFYVGWPEDPRDNRPRVYWGESAGNPYDAISPEELQWRDGEPLYLASSGGKEFVVQGRREGNPGDEIIPPILFVARRPLYRKRLNRKTYLVWGSGESRPCDDISAPTMEDDGTIVALGTEGPRIYRIAFEVK